MTTSIWCDTGDHDHCDGTVTINNAVWICDCTCHTAPPPAASGASR